MDPLRFTSTGPLRRQDSDVAGRRDAQDGSEEEPSSHEDQFCGSLALEEDLCPEEEIEEGQRHELELLSQHPPWACPAARERLRRCLTQLRPFGLRPDLKYRFEALDTLRPLASSCPNGAVFFSRGLLENLTSDQVLFFAAHEIAHTELRHFATRQRRLSELRGSFSGSPGNAARMRLEQAAVLAVRHFEEFEADHQAALWFGFPLGQDSMNSLGSLCRRVSPESLLRPTHPSFEVRVARLSQRLSPPQALEYCYTLLR